MADIRACAYGQNLRCENSVTSETGSGKPAQRRGCGGCCGRDRNTGGQNSRRTATAVLVVVMSVIQPSIAVDRAAFAPRAPQAFSIDEYLAFLRERPVTRADWSNTNWLGEPRARLLPGFLSRFDWLLDHNDWAHRDPITYREVKRRNLSTPDKRRRRNPRSVFASPFALERLLSALERGTRRGFLPKGDRDRVVVFAGSDQLLSNAFGITAGERKATLERLGNFFRRIFYMAKDIQLEGVRAMPIGILEHYLRQDLVAEGAVSAIAATRLDVPKDRSALLAVGGHGDYSENVSVFVPDARYQSFECRQQALRWALSPAGGRASVEVRNILAREWWRELAKYRFLISPWGDGVQSAKTIEALLVLTVPIVRRGPFPVFDELVDFGFPLVVVNEWKEVTAERLDDWWRLHAPRLEAFRSSCLTADGYWRFVMGRDERRCR